MHHHALLVETGQRSLEDIFSELQLDSEERFVFPDTTIGIEEVRRLTAGSYLKPETGVCRVIIVEVVTITVEAQNALLKLLEEPPASSRFIFVVRRGVSLLPTLRSRFLAVTSVSEEESNEEFVDFLRSDIAARLALLANRIEKKDDAWIRSIQSGLKQYVQRDMKKMSWNIEDISTIQLVLSRLGTRGSSAKMLLEELALSLPVDAR
jgi:DNA polymerase III delta prime subunit